MKTSEKIFLENNKISRNDAITKIVGLRKCSCENGKIGSFSKTVISYVEFDILSFCFFILLINMLKKRYLFSWKFYFSAKTAAVSFKNEFCGDFFQIFGHNFLVSHHMDLKFRREIRCNEYLKMKSKNFQISNHFGFFRPKIPKQLISIPCQNDQWNHFEIANFLCSRLPFTNLSYCAKFQPNWNSSFHFIRGFAFFQSGRRKKNRGRRIKPLGSWRPANDF